MNVKYSIILPVYNGMPYLVTCINTILNQEYNNFELVISDDGSTDGSTEYIKSLKDERINYITPTSKLSMSEHWEFALNHSTGEWLMFIGQDDGIHDYFFKLADKLTYIAKEKEINVISSRRSYYYWPGCETIYNKYVNYNAKNIIIEKNNSIDVIKALLTKKSYHYLPQMYTCSLFNKKLLEIARLKLGGKIFITHPQDAVLASIACSLEKKYLKSEIPLSWVGTSKKSAGMAISIGDEDNNEILDLKNEYKNSINNSRISYNALAGDFDYGDPKIYLWQALLSTKALRSPYIQKVLLSKMFKIIIFSASYNSTIRKSNKKKLLKYHQKICEINNVNYKIVIKNNKIITYIITFIFKIENKFRPKKSADNIKKVVYTNSRIDGDMVSYGKELHRILRKKQWL